MQLLPRVVHPTGAASNRRPAPEHCGCFLAGAVSSRGFFFFFFSFKVCSGSRRLGVAPGAFAPLVCAVQAAAVAPPTVSALVGIYAYSPHFFQDVVRLPGGASGALL